MFNPFGPAIMEEMLAKLREKRTGRLRIIYLNPLHDDELERAGWLTKVETIPKSNNYLGTRERFDTSIWQSRLLLKQHDVRPTCAVKVARLSDQFSIW